MDLGDLGMQRRDVPMAMARVPSVGQLVRPVLNVLAVDGDATPERAR